jgi:tetratricopeptide (TPR) repeat protein
MPATKADPPHSQRARPAQDAMERLYVYWVVSTGLLTLAMLVVAIMTRGTLERQNAAVNDLAEQVTALRGEVRDLQETGGARSRMEIPLAAQRPVPGAPGAQVSPAAPAREPVATRSAGPATLPADVAPSDSAMRKALDELMGDEPVTLADVTDAEAAGGLLTTAMQYASEARWSGQTWSRLAVLARLLAQDVIAADFAERAAAAGEPLTSYAEVSVRSLLARGRAQEALPLAENLRQHAPGSPDARVLAAAAFMGIDDPASADEVLETLPVPVVVPTYDKLLLARVLMDLEYWTRLEAVLSTVQSVPAELSAERSFLLAASLAHAGRTVEALALLDGLAAEEKPAAETKAARPWPWPQPSRYEIEVWRGVTLTLARQPEAARQVLQQAAALDSGRPEAPYYLGLLEAQVGRPDLAKMQLKNALAIAPRMVPAWEALASLEINEGDISLALQHLSQAVSINFRCALAHFLMAVAHAKESQKGAAEEALRITFQLDGSYLAEAKQTEVLLNLFTPAELDALAAEPAPEGLRPAPSETAAAGTPQGR